MPFCVDVYLFMYIFLTLHLEDDTGVYDRDDFAMEPSFHML